MLISAKTVNSTIYIKLRGDLDHYKASDLKNQLNKYADMPKIKRMVLDMKGMDFMDSAGVGLIMGLYKKLKNKNKQLYFFSPSPQIDKVLRVSGLYSIIPLIEQEVK
ncbi:MAG: STAS domain-containing protein [Bacillota bacterium]|jgi:stage II sporulation protein AA (anti-sigma F factor antagonist)|nr:STAS domain-containing protein [Bacillota bacterium]HHU42918.1 STAS domain-containing protein [Clostridiales bacterium]